MLAGIWPFKGKTVIDVRHAVLYNTPDPIAEARPEPVPPQLQEILDKAMSKDPKDRYQKISTMRDDLRAVLHEVSGDNLDLSLYAPRHINNKNVMKRAWNWVRGKSDTDSPSFRSGQSSASQPPAHISTDMSLSNTMTSDKKSIAILPFKNLSNDPNSSFYEFSLADAVITELAQLRQLIVRPSSVIAKYQGKEIDPREAGEELRVNAVLSAGFLRAGDKIRVTAQLVDVAGGDILWSDRIDAEGADIFDLQDTIGQRILGGLRLELTDGEQEKLGRRPTENADAYEEYLRGRDNFGRFIFRTVDPEDCDAAIANFKTAIELDPHFAGHGKLRRFYRRRSGVQQSHQARPQRARSPRVDGYDLSLARRKEKSPRRDKKIAGTVSQ
jgi:TolB-like protein